MSELATAPELADPLHAQATTTIVGKQGVSYSRGDASSCRCS